jgi:MFS transporter, DHA1 family, multidrug resistance protein
LGPIIANFSATAENWRWVSWEMLWLSAPICVCLFCFLPETSSSTILYYRAKRLRKLTGNASFRSQAELDQAKMNPRQIVYDALIKPAQINILDPAVLYSTVYTSLVYGIFYSFFESFPLVFEGIYGFSFGVSSLPFLGVLAGLTVGGGLVALHWRFFVEVPVMKEGVSALGVPEKRLVPALIACFGLPIGLFIFGTRSATPCEEGTPERN